MKITKVSIHDYLKLKDVEFNPGNATVVIGKNKQGKTSILKAIQEAFSGGGDKSAIRVGGTSAEIIIEMDDLNVKRTITEKGNYLDISNKQGMKMPSPQKYLNGILGVFSFNPIEFFEKKPAERKRYLLDAVKISITPEELTQYTGEKLDGLDFNSHALEVIEAARKFYYDSRTVANATKSKKEKALLDLKSKLPEGFIPDDTLEQRVIAMRQSVSNGKVDNVRIESMSKELSGLQARVVELTNEIKMCEEKIAEKQAVLMGLKPFDTAAAERELAEAEVALSNQKEVEYAMRTINDVRREFDEAKAEAERLDAVVKKLSKDAPAELIKKANLPIEGLSFEGDDIFVNGINVDNMSSSEQLKLGLDIVKALNGQFKVICIDGVELLDPESFAFFLKEVEDDGYQYFVTRVTDEQTPHSITIEDGTIKQ